MKMDMDSRTFTTTVVIVFLTGVISGGFLFGVGGPLHTDTERAQWCLSKYN